VAGAEVVATVADDGVGEVAPARPGREEHDPTGCGARRRCPGRARPGRKGHHPHLRCRSRLPSSADRIGTLVPPNRDERRWPATPAKPRIAL
jgi:hypothetical protein